MCVFCNIVEGKIPSNKVAENDEFMAFHDLNPKAPIHILIIPKKHVNSFHEVTAETMASMTKFIQEIAIVTGVDQTGYRLVTNIGKDGGQEVKHLHFHLLGGHPLKWDHIADSNPQDNF
jgi:histidine triad (HIT) family protein